MKLLQLQQVHGATINSRGMCEWNESQNEMYLCSGSVITVLNVRMSKIIKHISTNYESFPIKCFILSNDFKYIFTIQYEPDSSLPLISCIVIENGYTYKINVNNPFNKEDNISKSMTSLIKSITIFEDKIITFTKNELYVIKINFNKIYELSFNSLLANVESTKRENEYINLDIIGYVNTVTELFDVLWIDKHKFVCSGDKHLSIWRIIENNNYKIDVIRQKFKFGKYRNINEQSMKCGYSSTLIKIAFKLGIFSNSCFVCMELNKTKDTLFVITQEGILCTFSIEGRYLQKWVNLRMDKGYYITIHSSFIFCCGSLNKNRLFDTYSLKHLGSLPIYNCSNKFIIYAKIINNGKKIICIYNNGNIIISNMFKQDKENNNCIQYKFNIFRCIERNNFNERYNQIIQLENNNLIVVNKNGHLKCIIMNKCNSLQTIQLGNLLDENIQIQYI
eukprot:385398_1